MAEDAAHNSTDDSTEDSASKPNKEPTGKPFWSSRNYLNWFVSDTAGDLASMLQDFAQPLIVFALSHSIVLAGTVATISSLCTVFADLVGGTIVDRHNRKHMMIADAAIGAVLWGAVFALLATGNLSITLFIVISMCAKVARGLLGGASDAALRSIITTKQFGKAKTISEGRNATTALVSGPLGGLLYAVFSWLPYLGAAILYVIAGATAARMVLHSNPGDTAQTTNTTDASGNKAPAQPKQPQQPQQINRLQHAKSFMRDFAEGFSWTFHRYRLPFILAHSALFNIAAQGAQAVCQLQMVRTGASSFAIGCFTSFQGAGVLIGAVLANRLIDRTTTGAAIGLSSLAVCLSIVPMIFSDSYVFMYGFGLIAGLAIPLLNSSSMGFIFGRIPDEMQGRVGSVMSLFMMPLGYLSPLVISLILEHAGFTASAIFVECAGLGSLGIAVLTKRVREIPKPDQWEVTEI
jgi:MFS family permease